MGVCLRSKNKSVDMGYFSFNRLRQRLADMLSDEWSKHYALVHDSCMWSNEQAKAYDAKTNAMYADEKKWRRLAIVFLYKPDTGGKLGRKGCKSLAKLMDKNKEMWESSYEQFGYVAHMSFTLADFREMLQDGIDTGKGIRWS